jgi:hypothetical protein
MRGLSPRAEILNRFGLAIDTGNRDYMLDVAKYAMLDWIEAGEK